jgi:sigma-B regulation protein RsbU (phosphoserine phosphatase)
MADTHSSPAKDTDLEGDYRPAQTTQAAPGNIRIETADLAYLMELSDALNTTLDLQTLLTRTAEIVRKIIHYKIFAILLLNDRTRELRMHFQIGHTPQTSRKRIPLGQGVVGQVALTRQPILISDITEQDNYLSVNPEVKSELAIPLIAKNRLIGVLDLESEQPSYFRPEHLRLLKLTASRIAAAIENARLYTRVSRQAQTLEVLNEISVEIASILDLNPLLERVGQLLRRLIDYQLFTIMLLDDKGETLISRYAWRFGATHAPHWRVPVTKGVVGAAVSEWRSINVPDVSKDLRYLALNEETRSILVAPLFYKGKIIGVLDLEHTRTNFFTDAHERILATLAAQVAIAIENAKLYQTVRAQERQFERDITMAREVQLRLLPPAAPAHPHADMAVRFLPARSIGGDLYDFIDYGPGRTAIMLGDVSGKAAPAALLAAMVSGIMRAAAAQLPAPATMLALLNDSLQERKIESQYVTMLFSVWDDATQTLRIANSGSVQPVFFNHCQANTVKIEGFPLGLFPAVSYEEITVQAKQGDIIVFVSDGILDAENETEEMYGGERLNDVICEYGDKPATSIADAILADVTRFQGARDRFDDETIIVLKVR